MPSIILRNIRKRVRHKLMTHPLFVGINMLYDSCSISVINHQRQETASHFIIRKIQEIGIGIHIPIFNGEITALINHKATVLPHLPCNR